MKFKDNSLSGIIRSLVADEFLAWTSYYFYEIISQGKALNYTNKIFEENGKDELEDHYHKLVNWMQSNHIPVPTGLSEMQDICNTQYHALQDPSNTTDLVDQMITAEKEAIDAYVQAMKEPAVLEYPDLVIMLGEICNDEREHLKNLDDVKSNIDKYGDLTMNNFSERINKLFNFSLSPYVMISGVKTVYGDTETIYKEWDYKNPLNKWRLNLKKRYPKANIRGISKSVYDKLKKEKEESDILQSIKKLSKDVINNTPEFTQFKDCDYVLYGPTEYIDKMKEVAKKDGFNKSSYRESEFPHSLTGPRIVLGWRK